LWFLSARLLCRADGRLSFDWGRAGRQTSSPSRRVPERPASPTGPIRRVGTRTPSAARLGPRANPYTIPASAAGPAPPQSGPPVPAGQRSPPWRGPVSVGGAGLFRSGVVPCPNKAQYLLRRAWRLFITSQPTAQPIQPVSQPASQTSQGIGAPP